MGTELVVSAGHYPGAPVERRAGRDCARTYSARTVRALLRVSTAHRYRVIAGRGRQAPSMIKIMIQAQQLTVKKTRARAIKITLWANTW